MAFDTARFYELQADAYAKKTLHADLADIRQRFSALLPYGASLLDIGCGSGRDTLAFQREGFQVSAVDSSPAMARISSANTGQQTRVQRVEDLEALREYDGVWACAVLLHIAPEHQRETWQRIARSLRPAGVVYASYKLGSSARVAPDGRRFTDMTVHTVSCLAATAGLARQSVWLTRCSLGTDSQWVNIIAQRRDASLKGQS